MNKGIIISIIAGIITLVGTFILSWISLGKIHYVYGLGVIDDLLKIFTFVYYPPYISIIIGIIILLILASGVLQLIGIKFRATAIAGSILPIFIGVIILFRIFYDLPYIQLVYRFFIDAALVKGIIPFDFAIPGRPESIGTYALIAGGILGIISGCLKRESY